MMRIAGLSHNLFVGSTPLFNNYHSLHVVFIHLTPVKEEYSSRQVLVILCRKDARRRIVNVFYFPTF